MDFGDGSVECLRYYGGGMRVTGIEREGYSCVERLTPLRREKEKKERNRMGEKREVGGESDSKRE